MNVAPEMDAARQAAEILASLGPARGARLLDAGCGAGHFIHSLMKRGLDYSYFGVDFSPSMIAIGKEAFRDLGLDPARLLLESLDDLTGYAFDVAVVLNALSFNADFRRPLSRISDAGARTLLLRDNFGPRTVIRWERDGFLDPGHNHLKGYWNEWGEGEVEGFLRQEGFDSVIWIEDRRTGGRAEMVVEKPYHWRFLLARKEDLV
jgi:SAM-dependent methyltransferase